MFLKISHEICIKCMQMIPNSVKYFWCVLFHIICHQIMSRPMCMEMIPTYEEYLISSVESQKGYCSSKMFRWEPEGRYCSYKDVSVSSWEPEGRYCCTKSMAIWSAAPFWLSADDMCRTELSLSTIMDVVQYKTNSRIFSNGAAMGPWWN